MIRFWGLVLRKLISGILIVFLIGMGVISVQLQKNPTTPPSILGYSCWVLNEDVEFRSGYELEDLVLMKKQDSYHIKADVVFKLRNSKMMLQQIVEKWDVIYRAAEDTVSLEKNEILYRDIVGEVILRVPRVGSIYRLLTQRIVWLPCLILVCIVFAWKAGKPFDPDKRILNR